MKNKYLIVGSLAFFQFIAGAQNVDIPPPPTEHKIKLVYYHYLQDGDRSAVTGGKGTEELAVYGPSLSYQRKKNKRTIELKGGADIISSASTDKIDFITSSASILDTRMFLQGKIGSQISDQTTIDLGGGSSIESDYFSWNAKFSLTHLNKSEMTALTFKSSFYSDDLRWGRLSTDHYSPQFLIYPSELRDSEWHDEYKRLSYNIGFGLDQIVNARNRVGLLLDLSRQTGLLSTPFHRVYFTDESLRVENLPNFRNRASLTAKWNSFVSGRWVSNLDITAYSDSYKVASIGIQQAMVFKWTPFFSLKPSVRVLFQKGTNYFESYGQHHPESEHFTSDYDLADLTSYGVGVDFRWYNHPQLQSIGLEELVIRYQHYGQANRLSAHILTFSFQTQFTSKRKNNLE